MRVFWYVKSFFLFLCFSNSRAMFTTTIVKALDVWMAVCLIYVFGAFLEFAAVNTFHRRVKLLQKSTATNGPGINTGYNTRNGVEQERDSYLATAGNTPQHVVSCYWDGPHLYLTRAVLGNTPDDTCWQLNYSVNAEAYSIEAMEMY